jgi:general secretion pathway protein A
VTASSTALYAPFFGLAREPFSIAPDPRFLFMSEMHREALAHLLYGVAGGGGFVLLTGEIGAGKTTVCRCFLEQVPATCNVAYIVNPKLTVLELLKTVCDEFGIPIAPPTGLPAPSVKDYLDPLNRYVLDAHAAGRNNLLVIDEAQNLSADVLEQLRLLTNLETAERKLLQIVLIGQPELREQLAQPALEPLAQRVIARYHLPALSMAETALYVQHRLAVAGLQSEGPFDRAALRQVQRLTGGVPRRINLLCDRAMLGAYATGQRRIGRRVVEAAAREVFDRRPARPGRTAWAWLGGAAGGAAAVGAAVLLWPVPGTDMNPGDRTASTLGAAASAPQAVDTAAVTPAMQASTSASASAAVPAVPVVATAPLAPPVATAPLASPVAMASEAQAWRELASLWGVTLDEATDPCQAAARQQLHCFRGSSGLALIRQLGRPGIVALREGDTAGETSGETSGVRRAGYALLMDVGADSVTLRLDGGRLQTVPLAELARVWRGEFATLWRVPPGHGEGRAGAASPLLADWLVPRLPAPAAAAASSASGPASTSSAWRAQLQAFQLAQGLKPDGVPGPLTLMLLNRASGVSEPRLQTAN